MKRKKEKGSNAERELVEMFWENNFGALRVAGSGVSRIPCPDVLAGNGKTFFAVECKSTGSNYVHLTYSEIVKLVTFAQKFGAVPIIAIRFDGKDWVFFTVDKLKVTKGKNFKVSKDFAYRDGKRFYEIIGKYEQKKLID